MIEEGFVRMYAHDFAIFAARAETGVDVDSLVRKRIGEARSHAALMDARKGQGHLAAVADRVDHEAARSDIRAIRVGEDIAGAFARRRAFLTGIANTLRLPTPTEAPSIAVRPRRSAGL
jgi:hypothetical protein